MDVRPENILQLAVNESVRLKQIREREVKGSENNYGKMVELREAVLNKFHGVEGILKQGSDLYKNIMLIATIIIEYRGNQEYSLRWTVFNMTCEDIQSGMDLKEFGTAMGKWLL